MTTIFLNLGFTPSTAINARLRQGATQVEKILTTVYCLWEQIQSKVELKCLTIYQEPIHMPLEVIDVVLLLKNRLWQSIQHLRRADKEPLRLTVRLRSLSTWRGWRGCSNGSRKDLRLRNAIRQRRAISVKVVSIEKISEMLHHVWRKEAASLRWKPGLQDSSRDAPLGHRIKVSLWSSCSKVAAVLHDGTHCRFVKIENGLRMQKATRTIKTTDALWCLLEDGLDWKCWIENRALWNTCVLLPS